MTNTAPFKQLKRILGKGVISLGILNLKGVHILTEKQFNEVVNKIVSERIKNAKKS